MIYLQENLTIIPHGGFGEEYHDILKKDYLTDAEQKGQRLMGLFIMGIRYNEHFALWELDDWAALDRLQDFYDKEPWLEAWKLESIRYRTDWTRRVLEPTSFTPTLADIKKDSKYRSMIYLYSLSRIVPGKDDDYVASIEKDMVPMARKWGRELVGCYQTAAGQADSNEVTEIWTAGNTNSEYEEIRARSLSDPGLKRWENDAGLWRAEITCRMLYGVVSFAPLRASDEILQAMDTLKAAGKQ